MAVSATYEWLSGHEAVLRRPDAYVGSLEPQEATTLVYTEDGKTKSLNYCMSPILLKIVDEVIVNAVDSATRDSQVRSIQAQFDSRSGIITVENDGSGIPVELFKDTDRWIPSVIFSELHAGSNFADTDARLTGGRNGVGVSCTNIWSTFFEIETSDHRRLFKQVFENNLSIVHEACVEERVHKKGFVRVTFRPDYERLQIDLSLQAQTIEALIRQRCVEASICTRPGVVFQFQGVKLFSKPTEFLKHMSGAPDVISEDYGVQVGSGCTLALARRQRGSDFYGFVNGIRCDGGSLAAYIRDRLMKIIGDHLRKKQSVTVRSQTLRDVLAVLCVARIVNPSFTSQAKDTLSTSPKQFGFALDAQQPRILSKLQRLGIIDEILARETEKDLSVSVRKTLVPKSREVLLDKYDAALDCRRDPDGCTLILTEGDSAKALVIAGLSVLSREKYGVYPLRGVPLNVTNMTVQQMLKNNEVANIFRILNVAPSQEDMKGLRYGRIAICSDQDSDGTHICGLLLNLFMVTLPNLIRERPSFLQRIITPLVRATKGSERQSFFCMQDFNAWWQAEAQKRWQLKYYKGLGTSTSAEAREIFRQLERHTLTFQPDAAAEETFKIFYDEARIQDRKALLRSVYDANRCIDYGQSTCTMTNFMRNEHIHFSHYSVLRALPSAIDGLTPSRRKALFYFLCKPQEIKVAQAVAAIAQRTLYLHGENSLVETVVGLAQDYVGTNNVALLQPNGQFGSRNDKTSVHAAARYIFTQLDPIASALFPARDAPVLDYRVEEGTSVEPVYYVPVLPLLLLNGAAGIGTGFNTMIASYHLRDLVEAARAVMTGRELPAIRPHFEGFKGDVQLQASSIVTVGRIAYVHDKQLHISELPVGRWVESFLSDIKKRIETGKSEKGVTLHNVTNLSSEFHVDIYIQVEGPRLEEAELLKLFKLTTSFSLMNMHAFDADYQLQHYQSIEEIVRLHAKQRLTLYVKRIAHELQVLQRQMTLLRNRQAFLEAVAAERIALGRATKAEMIARFQELGLETVDDSYTYLLEMNVTALSRDNAQQLTEAIRDAGAQMKRLEETTPEALWEEELVALTEAHERYLQQLIQRHSGAEGRSVTPVHGKRVTAQRQGPAKRARAKVTG